MHGFPRTNPAVVLCMSADNNMTGSTGCVVAVLVAMENVPGGLPVVTKTRVGTCQAFLNLLLMVLSFKLDKFCSHVCLDV